MTREGALRILISSLYCELSSSSYVMDIEFHETDQQSGSIDLPLYAGHLSSMSAEREDSRVDSSRYDVCKN